MRSIKLLVLALLLSWMTRGADGGVVFSDSFVQSSGTLYLEMSSPSLVVTKSGSNQLVTKLTLASGVKPLSISVQFLGGDG